MSGLEEEVRRRVGQVASLERELRQTTHRCRSLREAVEGLECDRRRMVEEADLVRRERSGMEQKTMELQQIAAKTQYDAVALREQVKELEGERDALRCLVREERERLGGMEEALVVVQEREVVAQEEIRKLVREKASLLTRVNEANTSWL